MKLNPLIEGLRESGVKITPQRKAICEWLASNETHPNVASVYDALRLHTPGISLATVYNTLTLLQSLDLIYEVARANDGSIRYDTNTHPHINLICSECGKITDQQVPLPQLLQIRQIAQVEGFYLRDSSITLHGICSECQQQKGSNNDLD